jgi:hypothetical protein
MGKSVLYQVYLSQEPHKHQVCHEYGVSEYPPAIRTLQAAALGIADRNVGKVSGRAEFYQRLKALSVAPVKEPTSGAPQANYHFPHYRHRDRKSPS